MIILTPMMVCNIWYWAIEGVLRSLVRTDARGKPLPERQKPEPNAPLIRTPMPDFHLPATLYDLACVTGEKPMMVWQMPSRHSALCPKPWRMLTTVGSRDRGRPSG